jgi:hypothetical protein
MNELYATAICGNDLTSSVLYVIGVTSTMSGQLAPLCLLLVGFVLYLFKSVYGEAGTAIPLNGGAYNLLLNTTTKSVASLAACLTILSYVATAVIRASQIPLRSQPLHLPTSRHARTNPFQVDRNRVCVCVHLSIRLPILFHPVLLLVGLFPVS